EDEEDDEEEDEDPPLCISDNNRMFSWESLKAVFHGHKLDWMKSARLGHDAPNSEVVPLADPKRKRVLDFALAQRPLLTAVHEASQGYADIADALVIYIEEAHPSDGWISSDAPYQIRQHRSLEERLSAARLMAWEAPGCAIVADSMENSSNSALYIVQDGKVVYQGGRGPEGYRISELRHWLDQYRKRLRDAVIRV
ncbi:hypothetical protein M9458_033960, partial [Cirrhinus mrigala]